MDYRMPIYIQLQDIIVKIEEKNICQVKLFQVKEKMAEMYGVKQNDSEACC